MAKKTTEYIGDIMFKDNLIQGSEIIFDSKVSFVKDFSLSEADIDSRTASFLKKLGWIPEREFRQQKSNISEIDNYVKSKSIESKRKGKIDFYLLINDKLKVIVDNKRPKESTEKGIEDSKFYANCLIEKGYDIRIIMSYNGRECLFRVYNSKDKKWKPFYINGEEFKSFPSKELVNLIYRYNNCEGIKITEDYSSIQIHTIISKLKEIYRNVPHLQNDNQRTIDFTISFIALKLILEKHSHQLGKNWTDFNVSEQKKLKEKVKDAVEDIIDELEGYKEIFEIKEDKKGKIKSFDFIDLIKQFPNKISEKKGNLVKIFEALNELEHLHSSKFDIFSEIYQSLMDKSTKKMFGQFFTPRHLIKNIIRIFYKDELNKINESIKNKTFKKICDPCCGTGGFLTESFKYLATNLENKEVKELAKKSIHGFDIYPANAVRSRINMYLAGDGFSKIESTNALKYDEEKFDYILTNPPFGTGDFNVNKKIISSKRKEVNFLLKIIDLLKEDGKALIILPDGILESTNLNSLRSWLVKNCIIEKIIGLPKHIFAPYTHEKTYALFVKKRTSEIYDIEELESERIWMYIMDCDGYANSDRRFRTDKTKPNGEWLHDEISLWKDKRGSSHESLLENCWKRKVQKEGEVYTDEWNNETDGLKYGYVSMKDILSEKHVSYPTLNITEIKKIASRIDGKIKVKSKKDLFETYDIDTKILKEEFLEMFQKKGIIYDKYKDKFLNEKKPIIKNLVNLLPEKYIRSKKIEKITVKKFKEKNKKLVLNLEKEIEDLIKIVENLKNEN